MGLCGPGATTDATIPRRGSMPAAPVQLPRRRLTRGEREVLHLVCQRLSNPEIADRLFLGTRTVESHVASIRNKLNAAKRQEAATTTLLGLGC
jgi:DNA-binding NarL/FixJ family response regulator